MTSGAAATADPAAASTAPSASLSPPSSARPQAAWTAWSGGYGVSGEVSGGLGRRGGMFGEREWSDTEPNDVVNS